MKLENFSKSLGEAPWALEYRRQARSRLERMDLPKFRYGEKILIKPSLDFSAVALTSEASVSLSAKGHGGLEVFHDKAYSAVPVQLFSQFSFSNGSWFSHFNEAYSSSFIFIRVPRGASLSSSFFRIGFDVLPSAASVYILAEEGSKSTIILESGSALASADERSTRYVGLNVKVLAEPNSQVTVVGIQDFDGGASCFEERSACAKKDAVVNWVSLSVGASYHSLGFTTDLSDEGASTNMRCLYAASGSQKFDLFTRAVHNAPRTNSNILTRGVVNGSSRALSRGLISISSSAPGSFGFEKQDALVLGEDAEADAIPNLEINNYDVKCSHGSTIGQISEEDLFYLRSRGISADEAKKLIVQGFFHPLLALFEGEAREELELVLERAIG